MASPRHEVRIDGVNANTIPVIESILNLVRPYPPLFHYTRAESLQALLTSKGLLARPTWDFGDTEEYVYGLRLLREEIDLVLASEVKRSEFAANLTRAYGEFAPDAQAVLGQCLDLLGAEVTNFNNPAVQVYVACVTTDPNSERMAATYGRGVVGFSFELPWVAYHAPHPFTSTMLSRVAYDEQDFRRRAPQLGLSVGLGRPDDVQQQVAWLREQDLPARTRAVAAWTTEGLCLLAPNIKRPNFAFENEWRLKSAISTYATSPHFPRRQAQSRAGYLPAEASSPPMPGRYLQKLLSIDEGKMIVSGVGVPPEVDAAFWRWLAIWQRENASPMQAPMQEFAQGYARFRAGLLEG